MFKRKTQLDGKFILNFVTDDLSASMTTYAAPKAPFATDFPTAASMRVD